jgi:poly(3-hydroxybutyrate) depolymerase
LPDRRCSPGAYYSGLTKAVICSSGFSTSSIGDVPDSEKFRVEREYGMAARHYGHSIEIDHIVSLELGGSNGIANLFPEPGSGRASYHMKDRLENRLHDMLCAGKIGLRSIQRQISSNWEKLYRKVFGVKPPTTTTPPPPGGGGSTAICSPSPCTLGRYVTKTVSVPDSDYPGSASRTFTYVEQRPANLVGAAPLLIILAAHGNSDAAPQENYSPTGRFDTVAIDANHAIGHSGSEWAIPTLYPTAFGTCGPAADKTHVCDDIPAFVAIIHAVKADATMNIDPNKVYVTGSSKGAQMAEDLACDTRTSSLIHGFAATSYTLGSPAKPADQRVPPYCPSITGAALSWDGAYWGGARGLPVNTHLAALWVYGTADGLACLSSVGASPNCLDTGFAGHNGGPWQYSAPQMAGETDANLPAPATAAGSDVVFGHRMGCDGTPAYDSGPQGTAPVVEKIYRGCTDSKRATGTIRVTGGGHALGGLIPHAGGVDLVAMIWQFFSDYGGGNS